jgi:hypothetical protein
MLGGQHFAPGCSFAAKNSENSEESPDHAPGRRFTTGQRNLAPDFAAGTAKEVSVYNHGLRHKAGVRAYSLLTGA